MTPDLPLQNTERVDPSALSSDVARRIATKLNQDLQSVETRARRLNHVLREYLFYKPNGQLMLAQAASCWTMALIARHQHRDKCEQWFFAVLDAMYVSTDDAQMRLTESERENVHSAAAAIHECLWGECFQVFFESAEVMAQSSGENPFHDFCESLILAFVNEYLEHAMAMQLQSMIAHFVVLGRAIEGTERGVTSREEVVARLRGAWDDILGIIESVLKDIDAGRLAVVDGTIVRQGEDQPTNASASSRSDVPQITTE